MKSFNLFFFRFSCQGLASFSHAHSHGGEPCETHSHSHSHSHGHSHDEETSEHTHSHSHGQGLKFCQNFLNQIFFELTEIFLITK